MVCNAQLDLMLCMDGSRSITDSEFKIDLQAAAYIATNFSWGGKNGIAMGIVQYGSPNTFPQDPIVRTEQKLTDSKEDFLAGLAKVTQISGGTPTGDGLKQVLKEFEKDARPGAHKATLLITDGAPNLDGGEEAAVAASKALQNAGSPVFIIGVGDATENKQDIDKCASQPSSEYVVYAKHWEDVAGLLQTFLKKFCPHEDAPPAGWLTWMSE